ncbi:PIG-L family deacetylase [Fulvivirga sp. 29W222]|uniref:PIG-L family deacetylase n=2 Tax=Fulvivirga marina TaxID=2494733 RepID=A0A937G080_9BACT|nr:PIG-L family deacetylase [Fulvivirga marina]
MLPLRLDQRNGLKILCLGAHCDDIEIGCGGTLLKIIHEYAIDHIKWIVFTSTSERAEEAMKSAEYFLMDVADKEIIIEKFKDTVLPQQSAMVKEYFEEISEAFQPDLIFTHYRNDLHQDHRLLNELTWNTFRKQFILEYEILKYDGDLGNPGLYVPLSSDIANKKVRAILDNYLSQRTKHWFDEETFYALMRLRGVESASKYAEAFYMRKGIL